MSTEKQPSISPNKLPIPLDPRLEELPHVRLGPKSGNRDYGEISEHGVDNLSPRIRMELTEGIFRARAAQHQMGVWSERINLSDDQVAIFIYEAELANNERRVFGEAYVVTAERADQIEAVATERADAKRKQYIASLRKS